MPLIFLTVKLPDGGMVHTDIDSKTRVEEFKAILAPKIGIKKHRQRLVFAGRLMTEGKSLATFGVESRSTIHVLHADKGEHGPDGIDISDCPPQLAALQRHVLTNPDILGQMLESPAMQTLLNDQDLLRSLLKMDPRLSKLFQGSAELERMLNEPEFMQKAAETLRNPVHVRDVLRSTDRAVAQLEELKEGGAFANLRVMCEDIERPLQDEEFQEAERERRKRLKTPAKVDADQADAEIAMDVQQPPVWLGSFDTNAMASMVQDHNMQQLLAQLVHTMNGPSTKVHPDDPFVDASFVGQMWNGQTLQSMVLLQQSVEKLSLAAESGDSGKKDKTAAKKATSEQKVPADSPAALSGLHQTSPACNFKDSFALFLAAERESPEVRYKGQLQAMANMGFSDKDACIQALHTKNGNMSEAVSLLMGNQGK